MQGTPPDLAKWIAISEIARNIGLLLAGVIGVGIAAWRTYAAIRQAKAAEEQSELARRDHITEVFVRAVDQLASEKMEVRLAAIYTLRQISHEAPYRLWTRPIFQTLSAYLREKTGALEEPTADVRLIMDFLRDELARDSAEGHHDGNGSSAD